MATQSQSYADHRHQPRQTGLGFLFVVIALFGFVLRWFSIGGRYSMALGLGGLLAAVTMLLLISRTYTTALQDRIIKAEMRTRCSTLLSGAQQQTLWSLSKPQIVALRFASDAELPALVERAAREKMTADQIKRAITHWVPDWDRT